MTEINRAIAASIQHGPDTRTQLLLRLIGALEQGGPFFNGEIRPPSMREGLTDFFQRRSTYELETIIETVDEIMLKSARRIEVKSANHPYAIEVRYFD